MASLFIDTGSSCPGTSTTCACAFGPSCGSLLAPVP
jgi:hypothetical protein